MSESDNQVDDNYSATEIKNTQRVNLINVDPDCFRKDTCGALVLIDHAHHEIHEGNYIFVDDISDSLGSNAVKSWLLVTPEDSCLHSFPHIIGTGEFEFQSIEGVTVATNGTEIPMYNRNRNIDNTMGFKFYEDPTGVVVTNCPIVRSIRTGAGTQGIGDARSENELILKPNTKYLLRATSRSTGNYISMHINGYVCNIGL